MSTLVTQKAPDFVATAVMPDNSVGEIRLSDYRGKYTLLFFYPLDFTFVCPSEILAFNRKVEEFNKKDCQLIGISVDSHLPGVEGDRDRERRHRKRPVPARIRHQEGDRSRVRRSPRRLRGVEGPVLDRQGGCRPPRGSE